MDKNIKERIRLERRDIEIDAKRQALWDKISNLNSQIGILEVSKSSMEFLLPTEKDEEKIEEIKAAISSCDRSHKYLSDLRDHLYKMDDDYLEEIGEISKSMNYLISNKR